MNVSICIIVLDYLAFTISHDRSSNAQTSERWISICITGKTLRVMDNDHIVKMMSVSTGNGLLF